MSEHNRHEAIEAAARAAHSAGYSADGTVLPPEGQWDLPGLINSRKRYRRIARVAVEAYLATLRPETAQSDVAVVTREEFTATAADPNSWGYMEHPDLSPEQAWASEHRRNQSWARSPRLYRRTFTTHACPWTPVEPEVKS